MFNQLGTLARKWTSAVLGPDTLDNLVHGWKEGRNNNSNHGHQPINDGSLSTNWHRSKKFKNLTQSSKFSSTNNTATTSWLEPCRRDPKRCKYVECLAENFKHSKKAANMRAGEESNPS